jgi:hypothetical protein
MYELQQYVPGAGTFTGGYVPQELMPQSLFGGLLGHRLSDSIGCGPSGSLGQTIPNFGFPLGGGAGNAVLPFSVDPVALALSHQQTAAGGYVPQQLMLQSLLSGWLGPRMSHSYGCGPSGSLGQGMPGSGFLPFDADPVRAAYAYQQAQAMQAMQGML